MGEARLRRVYRKRLRVKSCPTGDYSRRKRRQFVANSATVAQNIQYIHTTQPVYLNSVLEHYTPARTLRSSDTNLLSVPRVRTCFGSRSFSVAAPTIWNSLPFDIRNSCSIASFRRKLKTFLFSTSSHVWCPLTPHVSASDSASLSPTLRALQIKFTYLLTVAVFGDSRRIRRLVASVDMT